MEYSFDKPYELYGQYYSLKDKCVLCGETLGEHGGIKSAPCPPYTPQLWKDGGGGPQFTPLSPALKVPSGA